MRFSSQYCPFKKAAKIRHRLWFHQYKISLSEISKLWSFWLVNQHVESTHQVAVRFFHYRIASGEEKMNEITEDSPRTNLRLLWGLLIVLTLISLQCPASEINLYSINTGSYVYHLTGNHGQYTENFENNFFSVERKKIVRRFHL